MTCYNENIHSHEVRRVMFPNSSSAVFSEQDCMLALYKSRWPDGFRCPRCAHHDAYRISTRKLPLFECKRCRTQTSLIAGTIMEGTRTPLSSWFLAISLHAAPNGINAKQLAQTLSVTYKTAWLICHKIRHAMRCAEHKQLLTGLVKIASGIIRNYYSGEYARKWHSRTQSVLIGASEHHPGQFHKIKIKLQNKQNLDHKHQIPDPTAFIEHNIAEEARASARKPTSVRDNDYAVRRIGRAAEIQISQIYRGVSLKHLQSYLDQYCYIWNHKSQGLFNRLLQDCAKTRTITYKALIVSESAAFVQTSTSHAA